MENAILAAPPARVAHGMIILGDDFRIMSCSPACADITGYDAAEIFGQTLDIMSGPSTDSATLKQIADALESGGEFAGEVLHYRKSGGPFWNELTIAPQRTDKGLISHYVAVIRDITIKKQNESRLAMLEADYRLIFNNAQAGLVLHKADTSILYANPMARTLLGVEDETIVGAINTDPRWQFIRETGELLPIAEYPVNRVLAEGKPVMNMEFGNQRISDGKLVWLMCSAFPVLDEQDEVAEVLTSFTDITDLKNHERAAELARERFELVAEATLDVVFDWDLETGKFWANRNFERTFGFPPFDVVMLDEFKAVHLYEEDRPAAIADLDHAIAAGRDRLVQEYRFIRADGSIGYSRAFVRLVRSPEGRVIRLIGTLSDITEFKEADRKLQVSEERFRVVAGLSNDVVWDWNLETGELWRSEGLVRKLGFAPVERHAGYDFWKQQIHPDDREFINQSVKRAITGPDLRWEAEYRFIDSAGKALVVQDRAAIIRNEQGKAIRLLGSMTDITEQREMDARLRQSQKLEAIGQLTGGVAHDFNNMLLVIGGNAELLKEFALPPEAREMTDLIVEASAHGADLTSRLLSFARRQPLEARPLNVETQLASAVTLLNRVLPENITITIECAGGLWQAEADAGQLENALVNLSLNAKDAMPTGGRLSLAASNLKVTKEAAKIDPELKPGDYVQILVTDTGCGMLPEVVEKVFDPFFTTKPVGEGTGLGLSMVYGFAKQSGGHVSVTSEIDIGTTVRLLLPRTREKSVAPQTNMREVELPSGTETILLVEDNDLVRAHVLKQLQMLGYTVISSANGVEGLEELKKDQAIDLLFSDIVMPGGMDGIMLANAARELRPDLKIVLTSGYSENMIAQNGELEASVYLLPKPYRRKDLAFKLRKALDGLSPTIRIA